MRLKQKYPPLSSKEGANNPTACKLAFKKEQRINIAILNWELLSLILPECHKHRIRDMNSVRWLWLNGIWFMPT